MGIYFFFVIMLTETGHDEQSAYFDLAINIFVLNLNKRRGVDVSIQVTPKLKCSVLGEYPGLSNDPERVTVLDDGCISSVAYRPSKLSCFSGDYA